jgi:Ni,Fe-hydrogenase III component G
MTPGLAELETAQKLLAAWPSEPSETNGCGLSVVIPASDLIPAVLILLQNQWGFLSAITALDPGSEQAVLELLYNFCSGPAVLTLRLRVSRRKPEVASLCGLLPCASVFEREIHEMFGVDVVGIPDASRLYLSEDWPAGIYPMLKDAILPST